MRHNPRCCRSSAVLRRSQAEGQESANVLNSSLLCSHIPSYVPVFPTRSPVFLDMIAVVWKAVPSGRAWGWKQSP